MSKGTLPRIAAAVCDSMKRLREPRVHDDDAVLAEFARLQITTLRGLLKTLSSLPPQIRLHTVLVLGKLQYRTAAPALFKLILDEDKVASMAAVALAEIANSHHVRRALRELSKAHSEWVRYALVEFLNFCDALTTEECSLFLDACLTIALNPCENPSLRARTLVALAVCSYQLDKRTRLARRIPHELANLSADPSKEVRASADYALRVLRQTGFM